MQGERLNEKVYLEEDVYDLEVEEHRVGRLEFLIVTIVYAVLLSLVILLAKKVGSFIGINVGPAYMLLIVLCSLSVEHLKTVLVINRVIALCFVEIASIGIKSMIIHLALYCVYFLPLAMLTLYATRLINCTQNMTYGYLSSILLVTLCTYHKVFMPMCNFVIRTYIGLVQRISLYSNAFSQKILSISNVDLDEDFEG